jgi:hypothetical protein
MYAYSFWGGMPYPSFTGSNAIDLLAYTVALMVLWGALLWAMIYDDKHRPIENPIVSFIAIISGILILVLPIFIGSVIGGPFSNVEFNQIFSYVVVTISEIAALWFVLKVILRAFIKLGVVSKLCAM